MTIQTPARRLVASLVLVCALGFGLAAFLPAVSADCGNPTGSSGCKGQTSRDVTAPTPADADETLLGTIAASLGELVARLFG
jgi:hypothetical protein